MELARALKILKLNHVCTLDTLNNSFRKLAKIYHPDSNIGRESWANRAMTELNLAYETVLDYLTSGSRGKVVEGDRLKASAKDLTKKYDFQIRFSRAINQVLDGIYTYYQYGLNSVPLRYEGVRRFRYRDALRSLEEGIGHLEALDASSVTAFDRVKLRTFIDFAKAFFQNMLIEVIYTPSMDPAEEKAYWHYYNGSIHLDYAIKDAFFGDELIQVRDGSYGEKMELCNKELMTVIVRYNQSGYISETLLKVYLLETFTRVVNLLHRMRH
ncbi:MAG: J domain-containing protein [Spirochaetota bacterium]